MPACKEHYDRFTKAFDTMAKSKWGSLRVCRSEELERERGVANYCHENYDWSSVEDNPDIMYVQMGEETDLDYQVIFRSYLGNSKFWKK